MLSTSRSILFFVLANDYYCFGMEIFFAVFIHISNFSFRLRMANRIYSERWKKINGFGANAFMLENMIYLKMFWICVWARFLSCCFAIFVFHLHLLPPFYSFWLLLNTGARFIDCIEVAHSCFQFFSHCVCVCDSKSICVKCNKSVERKRHTKNYSFLDFACRALSQSHPAY